MKRAHRQRQGLGTIELIEQAVHVLRCAPPATLAVYFAGAIPFVLGLLFFWADMSRSPDANQHLGAASLGMAALFLWLKFCQALFGRRIRAQITARPMPHWTVRQYGRVFLSQAIIQPTGLFLLPLSLVATIPFPWIYAFYQNATALADNPQDTVSSLTSKSWRQAKLWPGQNHLVQAFLLGFGLCVLLNWISVCLALPQLARMLFGVESVFARGGLAMLNTTFLAAMLGLTYLCLDPLLKVIYTLRCFQGGSLQSGEDLKADLRQCSLSGSQLAAGVVIVLLFGCAVTARASEPATVTEPARPPVARQSVSSSELDRAIAQTIHERKFAWRLPREKITEPGDSQGVLGKFLAQIGRMLRDGLRWFFDWLGDFLEKLFKRIFKPPSDASSSGYGWMTVQQVLLSALVAVAGGALAWLLIRVWRNRRRPAVTASEAIQPAPDLEDENVGADQLPEDGWTRLAQELLERGDFRLAMRALYLASLAHLAARNLISLARFKSNRDYERELCRRGHAFPILAAIFGDNVSVLERIWYGRHEASREMACDFAANVDRIKAGA